MKTPKFNTTPHPKKNAGNFKEGKVRKSLGSISTKKANPLASMQKMGITYETVKDNENVVNVKFDKNKKGRLSLPANALSKKSNDKTPSPENKPKFALDTKTPNVFSPKTPPPKVLNKTGSKKVNEKEVPKKQKHLNNLNKSGEQEEHNSSPIKASNDLKKPVKVAFDINNKKSEKENKQNSSSPEVNLGLKLEGTLSPKSKNARKRQRRKAMQEAGKVEVVKEEKSSPSVNSDQTEKKKKRRRRRKRSITEKEVGSIFEKNNAQNAVKALLSSVVSTKSEKKELFDDSEFIYLQFNLFKSTPTSKGVHHITLPNSILPDPASICLITQDIKGKRNDPEEAVDFYTNLMKEKGIDCISEIIPMRKLKKEYSQFEERTKLANRFDAVLVDGRIGKMARMGRRFASTKKCLSAVKLTLNDLKREFDKALRKVAIFDSGNGLSFSVKCGRIGMAPEKICDNIITIGEFFRNNRTFIGDKINVSSAYIKTALSKSWPLFMSVASSKDVPVPKGKEKKLPEKVEDEVSTVLGGTVVVYPSGKVMVKKRKNESADSVVESKAKKSKTENVTLSKVKNAETESESSSDEEELDTSAELNESGDESDEEFGSDFEVESGDDDDSDMEEVDEEEDDEAEDDDDEDDEEEESDDEDETDDDSDSDAEIEAAENEYLKEVRELQDEISKKKAKHRVLKDKIQEISEQMKQNKSAAKQESKNKELQLKEKSGKPQGKPQVNQNKKNSNQLETKKGKQNENVEGNKKDFSPKQGKHFQWKKGFSPKQDRNNAKFQGKKDFSPKQNQKNVRPQQAQQTGPPKEGKKQFNASTQNADSPKQNNKNFAKNKKQGNMNASPNRNNAERMNFSKKGKFEKGKGGKASFSVPGKKFQPQKK